MRIMKTTTLSSKHSRNRSSWLLIPLALACFALSPQARATCQEGCGSTNNTFLGDNARISNITSNDNTAIGSQALYNNNAYDNTATGVQALYNNATGSVNTANGFRALLSNTPGLANT